MPEPRLLHYSAAPLGEVRDAPQPAVPHFKPVGLWLSVEGEDDWPSWCRAADFRLDQLNCAAQIILRRRAKMLRLSSAEDIDALTQRYQKSPHPRLTSTVFIDWHAIAERYDGIIIAPYIWSRRRITSGADWYYPWDCASGCIWRARAIERVEAADG